MLVCVRAWCECTLLFVLWGQACCSCWKTTAVAITFCLEPTCVWLLTAHVCYANCYTDWFREIHVQWILVSPPHTAKSFNPLQFPSTNTSANENRVNPPNSLIHHISENELPRINKNLLYVIPPLERLHRGGSFAWDTSDLTLSTKDPFPVIHSKGDMQHT